MLNYEILPDDGIVIVKPGGPLSEDDFLRLAAGVDEYLESHDALKGLLIQVKEFPGWESLSGFIQHMKFIKGHHERIAKVALVSDSKLASIAPHIANHFIAAGVKRFKYDDADAALTWLRED